MSPHSVGPSNHSPHLYPRFEESGTPLHHGEGRVHYAIVVTLEKPNLLIEAHCNFLLRLMLGLEGCGGGWPPSTLLFLSNHFGTLEIDQQPVVIKTLITVMLLNLE